MNKEKTFTTRKIAFLGLMLSLIFVILIFERTLPPLPFFPPNFKLGISNVVVMFIVFSIGPKEAFTIGVLKSLFNALQRGIVAGLISFGGGMLSILALVLLAYILRNKISFVTLSIIGAICHNLGQLVMASFLLSSPHLLIGYLPILIIAGIVLGAFTGMATQTIMPIFERIYKR